LVIAARASDFFVYVIIIGTFEVNSANTPGHVTMKDDRRTGNYKPFKHLDRLIEIKSLPLYTAPKLPVSAVTDDAEDPACERDLFNEAMSGVVPIMQDKYSPNENLAAVLVHKEPCRPQCEVLQKLDELVQSGDGFIVADTPEYHEGVGHRVHPKATQHLHGGRFSIQAHIDLHGLSAPQAERAVDDFLRKAIRSGKRAVLVVHGRGLSSPRRPILKTKVRDWLTRGTWRKWVMAFTSARLCDGGAGATYVLLRQRPVTRQVRKKRPHR
jgi:DNA-nicking Smr family endonuclease